MSRSPEPLPFWPEGPDEDRAAPIWRDGSPTLEVEVSDNPVVGVLLGPDGEPLVELRARPPIGFAKGAA